MTDDEIRIEARTLAAKLWYRGVEASVMAGLYDDLGDVIHFAEAAIRRGLELGAEGKSQ